MVLVFYILFVSVIAGLVSGLLGVNVGEERTVPVTLPDTWQPEQLRGVKANCTCKVQEIFEWDLPEVGPLLCEVFISCVA